MAQALFQPPPLSQFAIPNYPAPQNPNTLMPYFIGNVFWPLGPNSVFNYSGFKLPESTEFEILGSVDSEYYEASIFDLPNNSFLEDFRRDSFFVPKSSVDQLKQNSNGRYTLTSETVFYQRQEIQNRNLDDETCTDCKKPETKIKKDSEKIKDVRLELIKKKILDDNSVPKKAFLNAFDYYKKNKHKVRNHDYLTVVDYNLPSTVPRLFLINLKDGSVEKHMVSHGKNSSGKGALRNYAVKYTNEPATNTSSHGAFLTGETYHGTFGYSLRIDGQQTVNSNARKRAIVIHPFDKVTSSKAGDTWGCFGLSRNVSKSIINKTKNGSVWYAEPYKG